MIALIDDNRHIHGVEPICRVLPIAPFTCHEHIAQRHDPTRLWTRARQDMALKPEIARVFAENFTVYGVRQISSIVAATTTVAKAGHLATRETRPLSG